MENEVEDMIKGGISDELARQLIQLKLRVNQLEKKKVKLTKRRTPVENNSEISKKYSLEKLSEIRCYACRSTNQCCSLFAEEVSINGVKEIVRVKHPIVKALWAVVFLFCVLLTAYYIHRNVKAFLEDPTATKVKLLRQDKYDYPSMYLCLDTWLSLEKTRKANITIEALKYALGYLMNFNMRPAPFTILNYTAAQRDFDEWLAGSNYTNLVEAFKDFAMDSSEFIHKCPFCKTRTFRKVLMNEAICYQIPTERGMDAKTTTRGTLDLLEVRVPDRSAGYVHRRKYWRFFINTDPYIGVPTTHFVQVFPNRSNTIRFTPMKFVALNSKEDPCVPENSMRKDYSSRACALTCASKTSNCTHMGNFRTSSLSKNLTGLCHYYPEDYWEKVKKMPKDKDLADEVPTHCLEDCPPLCERWWYEVTVESHPLSSPSDVALKTISMASRFLKHGLLQPDPLLTRMYFLNTAPLQGGVLFFNEVSTYSVEALVGNVGGVLGLCLGASIMSFVQCAMFIFTYCLIRPIKKRRGSYSDTHSDDKPWAGSPTERRVGMPTLL